MDNHNAFEIVVLVIKIIIEIWNYGPVLKDIQIWTYDNDNDVGSKCDTNVILRSFDD